MTKFLISFLLFVFFTSCGFCKTYTIDELLQIAQEKSVNIKLAQHLTNSQKNLANQQKYWNNPTAIFNNSTGKNSYSLNQEIPFYGKLQNLYNIQESQHQALTAKQNNVIIFVKTEVFRLIYQYQAIKKQIELSQKRLDRLRLVDKYLVAIILNSPTKKAQQQITTNRIKLIERDLIKFQNELYITWNLANIYLNLDQQPKNIILEWIDKNNHQDKNLLINEALENNWDLKEQKALINKAKFELSFAKIEQMPNSNLKCARCNYLKTFGCEHLTPVRNDLATQYELCTRRISERHSGGSKCSILWRR